MTILRHYVMTATEGRADDLRAALVELASKVRALPACQGIELLVDSDNEAVLMFVERWSSVEAHRDAGKVLGKAAFAPIVPLLRDPPIARYLEPLELT